MGADAIFHGISLHPALRGDSRAEERVRLAIDGRGRGLFAAQSPQLRFQLRSASLGGGGAGLSS